MSKTTTLIANPSSGERTTIQTYVATTVKKSFPIFTIVPVKNSLN